MPSRLVVIAGPDQGKAFPLPTAGAVLIGRGRDAVVRLNDPHASRSHCQVKLDSGRVVVEDMDSSSGVFVNEARVRSQAVQSGDLLRIGGTVLRLEAEDLADQVTLPPPAPKQQSGETIAATAPLAKLPAARQPVARPAPPPGIASAPTPRIAAGAPLQNLIGQVVGPFQVGSMIATGKTGIVFKARDTRDNQHVALKVFFPDFTRDEEEMQRFLRAMKTVLPLRHPHLVTVQAAGRNGPHYWVSMELVEGASMAPAVRHAATGAGDWRIAFRVVLHIARVLAYLHAQNILHRNITPSNVLLSTADGIVKLGDLMTAKAQEGKLARQVTQAGEIVGEVRFLSPEQTTNASAGDGRADLYSLGATAYAILAGKPPLEGRTPVETILKIRQAEPAPLRQFQPTLPPTFEAVVTKLLAKRAEDRYQSAGELLGVMAPLAVGVI